MSIARWIGKERFKRRLRALPNAIREEIRRALAQNADELVAEQKRVAPVKTGTLRDNIKWRWGAKSKRIDASLRDSFAITIYIGKAAHHYAHLVEFGAAGHPNKGRFAGTQNPGSPAQPFFFPTYRAKKRRMKGRARRALKKAIAKTRGA